MLKVNELILPYFVVPGKNKIEPIGSMPGVSRFSADKLLREVDGAVKSGIKAVLLFGIAQYKDNAGSDGYSEDGAVQTAVTEIKKRFQKLTVMTDVCLCEYTKHGHCGILKRRNSSCVVRRASCVPPQAHRNTQYAIRNTKHILFDSNKTLKALANVACSHAQAGADIVAPSAMMNRQVAAIRSGLDKNGFKKIRIMGYSAKFYSSFYGPFRDAADSAPQFGDRSSYQLNPANKKRALGEVKEDIKEGADIVMVKPALAYLDIISAVKEKFKKPLAAYNVSGEYSMVKFASLAGACDERKIVLEILTAIKRAGADYIISYHAKDAAKWIKS